MVNLVRYKLKTADFLLMKQVNNLIDFFLLSLLLKHFFNMDLLSPAAVKGIQTLATESEVQAGHCRSVTSLAVRCESVKLHLLISLSLPPSTQQHSNASQSLCDIIRLSREQMIQIQDSPEPDQLLATLEK